LQLIEVNFVTLVVFRVFDPHGHGLHSILRESSRRLDHAPAAVHVTPIVVRRNGCCLLLVFVFNSGHIYLELDLGDHLGSLSAENPRHGLLRPGNYRIVQTLLSRHQDTWLL
jgi:hypothetical protein